MVDPLSVRERIVNGEIRVVSPWDGKEIVRIPTTPPENIPEVVEKVRLAQERWRRVPLRERGKILRKILKPFYRRSEELVDRLYLEVGRHRAESWFQEIVPNLDLVRYWSGPGARFLHDEKVFLNPVSYPGKKAYITLLPRGVVGVITPWNYPVSIPLRNIIPALLSGNGVVWKPSEYSAWVSELLYEIFQEVLPFREILMVVHGGPRVGARLLQEVDGISFTGSLKVGEEVARRAGERMIPASLELGGKDLAVVLPDADLDRASAGIAWAAFTNAGQNCSAVEVVFVAEEIKHAFLEKLREEVKKMTPFVGPLIHEGQKSKVQSHLEEALERGALIVEGGEWDPNSPLLLRPTLLTRVHLESRIVLEETFGPVLPVLPYKDLKEVFHFLENSRYGLTISFWTKNPDFLLEKIKGLPVGVITINTHAMTAAIPSLPWSGVKGSGLGATNSHHALHWMVRPQTILVDRSPFREVFWHPYSEIAENLARGFSALLSGSFSISALWRVVRGFLFRWKKS